MAAFDVARETFKRVSFDLDYAATKNQNWRSMEKELNKHLVMASSFVTL